MRMVAMSVVIKSVGEPAWWYGTDGYMHQCGDTHSLEDMNTLEFHLDDHQTEAGVLRKLAEYCGAYGAKAYWLQYIDYGEDKFYKLLRSDMADAGRPVITAIAYFTFNGSAPNINPTIGPLACILQPFPPEDEALRVILECIADNRAKRII